MAKTFQDLIGRSTGRAPRSPADAGRAVRRNLSRVTGPNRSAWGQHTAVQRILGQGVKTGGVTRGAPAGVGLMSQWQQARDDANAANEERYKNIKGRYENRRTRALSTLDQQTNQDRADIDERYENQAQAEQQNLVARGLVGSTLLPQAQRAVERERSAAHNRLSDQRLGRRIGYDTGLEGDLLGFMERRTDQGPDPALLAQLMQGVGASGFGMPGPGGPGGGGGIPPQLWAMLMRGRPGQGLKDAPWVTQGPPQFNPAWMKPPRRPGPARPAIPSQSWPQGTENPVFANPPGSRDV